MMIRKRNILMSVTLIVFFCVVAFAVSAQKPQQPYIAYHQLVVQAEEAILDEDYQNALSIYVKAIAIVDYAFTKDLYNAAVCAAIGDDTATLFILMERCLKQGAEFTTFENNRTVFSRFFPIKQWHIIENEKDNYRKEYLSHLNMPYKRALDSLNSIDQMARSGNVYSLLHRPQSKKAQQRREIIRQTDSSNYEAIKQLIEQFGYPSERNIGVGRTLNYFGHVCIWHITDSSFLDVQKDAFLNGEIPVERYVAKMEYSHKDCYNYLYHCENESRDENYDSRRVAIGFPQTRFFEKLKQYHKKTHNEFGFLFLYFN